MVTGSPVGRRTFLLGGVGTAVLGGLAAGGCGLVEAGGSQRKTKASHGTGPAVSGRYFSQARGTTVGWTISYPPGHKPGDRLPLVLALHGYTGTHAYPIGPVAPVQLLASRYRGRRLQPMAVAAIDGGNDYWHAHPGDNPMRMLLDEFLPMCRDRGLGVGMDRKIGLTGESMGGYGALLLAEQHPQLVAAIAVISPAVWTTYADSQNANPTAFTSPADFAKHDVITHASALSGIPLRLTSGAQDPFHPYLESLVPVLPAGSHLSFPPGGHDNTFFGSQSIPSLAFIGRHLAA